MTPMSPEFEKKQIRIFGIFVAAICLLLVVFANIRSTTRLIVAIGGLYTFVGGVLWQPALRPVFRVWMKIAAALGWFNTRLLLGLLYYTLFSLAGLIHRILGLDLLALTRPDAPTLWLPRTEPKGGRQRYFRQF